MMIIIINKSTISEVIMMNVKKLVFINILIFNIIGMTIFCGLLREIFPGKGYWIGFSIILAMLIVAYFIIKEKIIFVYLIQFIIWGININFTYIYIIVYIVPVWLCSSIIFKIFSIVKMDKMDVNFNLYKRLIICFGLPMEVILLVAILYKVIIN